MLNECIEGLDIKPNGIYVDGTMGGAGHSKEIAKRISNEGLLIGIDRDQEAICVAKERLAEFSNVKFVHDNHDNIKAILEELDIPGVDGILLDLGVSSYQLDERNRGFSYMGEAELDMRMDRSQKLTAKTVVNKYSEEELRQMTLASNSLRELIVKIGYVAPTGSTSKTVKKRLIKYGISTDHFGTKQECQKRRTFEDVFRQGSDVGQTTLRRWFHKISNIPYQCSICGLEPMWQGKALTLILDHINGINNDNRLENLRWVCPNCNQQLDTTGYKEMRVKK